MQVGTTISLPQGSARILSRVQVESCEAWKAAFSDKCKDHRFYEIMDQTLRHDFEYEYLLLQDKSGTVRAIQPFFLIRQNLLEGVPGKMRSAVEAFRKIFPSFLTMQTLMVGCAAGASHLGSCLPEDEEWVAEGLHASLAIFARRRGASLVVMKDFPASYRRALRGFSSNGYARVPSMPMTRLSLKFSDFEEYLNSLGKATRKNLRRKFRKTEAAAPIEMQVVEDIAPYIEEIYPLYLQVHERSRFKFERLTREYFCSLGRRMSERTRFFVWRQLGKVIAFSLCMIHDGTIYDECLGLDYAVALDLHLYFYTLRDIFKWAMDQGLDSYCSSPLNYDPKLHLGGMLVPLDLYVTHTGGLLNPILRRALKFLGPTRYDPVLRRFPNADQL